LKRFWIRHVVYLRNNGDALLRIFKVIRVGLRVKPAGKMP
jgi:hypothetical protein